MVGQLGRPAQEPIRMRDPEIRHQPTPWDEMISAMTERMEMLLTMRSEPRVIVAEESE